jgi:WD40 repeat protein
MKVWSTVDYSLLESIPAHLYSIYSIAFHPTLPFIATASRDKSIKIWDAETFQLLKTISIEKGFDGHHLSINKIIWEPVNNKLISVSDDKLLKIWQIDFIEQAYNN